ncbi:MAG: hypothetical protein LBM98_00770 [Oscillospiraceae bacterium]|nr:hypothetical protein [Oscillospiraceae bacterium]
MDGVTRLGKLCAARNDGAPGRRTREGTRKNHECNIVQTLVLIPSVEGCRPQAAGWFPRRAQPPSKPP